MSNSGVMLSGWLRKSPPKKKLRKHAWKKRWFVLRSGRLSGDPNLLEYYKHQGSKKPLRAISLDECTQIDANVPVKYDRKDPDHQYVFDIVTKSRIYYLVAGSPLEMSSWVRFLCDLCGFNHDNPENQDLGSQQQTFKAVQPIQGRTGFQNGTSSLLEHEQESPLSDEVPAPAPRPSNTITKRSVLIRGKKTDANDNVGNAESNLPNGSSSAESGHVSTTGTPSSPRKSVPAVKNGGYNFAVDSSQQDREGSPSEYLLLADFKTAPTSQDADEGALLSASSAMGERRPSTDSVFEHEGAVSDTGSDVVMEQPLKSIPLRFASNVHAQRLDSMPDCPPPAPPVKIVGGTRPDERGYLYPPDDVIDDDIVTEARKRSCRSSRGLSPIDDSDNNRVPLNLQREFHVDEMGNPVPGFIANPGSSRFGVYGGQDSGTEYINTADASAEAGIANFSTFSRPMATQQQFPIPGRPFLSPTNQSATSQFSSPVFFNSPTQSEGPYNVRGQVYDVPSPLVPVYASPGSGRAYNSSLSKGSIYSSANTLSPYGSKGSPMKVNSPYMSSQHHKPRMRRSSSVGQLENVANDLAAQTTDNHPPTYGRRCSIDHRHERNMFRSPPPQTTFHGPPTAQGRAEGGTKSNVPPPRPPKSEATVKQSLNGLVPPTSSNYRGEAVEYSNLMRSHSIDETRPPPRIDPSLSPPHTSVMVGFDIPDSPPHTQVVRVIDDGESSPSSSQATTSKNPLSQPPSVSGKGGTSGTSSPVQRHDSTSSNSSADSGSTTGSSRSQSPSAVYELPPSGGHRPGFSVYDNPSSKNVGADGSAASSLYDFPKQRAHGLSGYASYDTPTKPVQAFPENGYSLYDSPKLRAPCENQDGPATSDFRPPTDSGINFPDIDETPSSYEMMMDQAAMSSFAGIDDLQLYTCMAGASAMASTPVFTKNNALSPVGRPPAASEPPPVKRDLKPGRRSIGSDSDSNKPHVPIGSYDESFSDLSSIQSQTPDGPLSPPHTTILHIMPTTPVLGQRPVETMHTMRSHDRLMPPERPPKHTSQSSLSPRTPPSVAVAPHLSGRAYPPSYGADRAHKAVYDNQVTHSPLLTHQGPRQRSVPNPVPGRPPKPVSMSMIHGTPPTSGMREEFSGMHVRDFGNIPSRSIRSNPLVLEHGNGSFFPRSSQVPPPPMEQVEKELKYVEIESTLISHGDATSGAHSDSITGTGNFEKLSRPEAAVEYVTLDKEKTGALEKMRIEREKEQLKRGFPDMKANKSGKG